MSSDKMLAKFIAENVDKLSESQLKELIKILQKQILEEEGNKHENCKN